VLAVFVGVIRQLSISFRFRALKELRMQQRHRPFGLRAVPSRVTIASLFVAVLIIVTSGCAGTVGQPSPNKTAPSITTQPQSQTVAANGNAIFSVVAAGTAPLTYQWTKNSAAISGATSSTLQLSSVTSANAGNYAVVVSNPYGSLTSVSASLTVTAGVAPSITTQPQSQTVAANGNVTFSVVASGTAPLSYQWTKNSAAISGATSSTLQLSSVNSANAGNYAVTVTNTYGNITSASATLTVTPAGVAPSITTQPQSQTVAANSIVSFTVVAAGTAPFTYQWTQNSAAISGATSATLQINSVTSADAGEYAVTVTNAYGNITSASATLTVTASSPGTVEQPGPSAALYAAPFYTCENNFYVATDGNDSNPGTQAEPWATIQNADTPARAGGDCINVAAGTYEANVLIQHGGSAPTATGYVVYRCAALDACHILAPGGGHLWGFEKAGNFVVVDGFELDGNNALLADGIADACIASDDETYGEGTDSLNAGNSSHHIWILNNILHHCNLAGVSFNDKEYIYAIHNTVYHNSFTSGYQGSGVGFVSVQCIEQGEANCYTSGPAGDFGYVPSGNDLIYAPASGGYYPFHNVVAWNSVFNNRTASNNPVPCGAHTDGNGIIMDTFTDRQTTTLIYPYQTLVANNVSFYNGGRGIHVFRTSNVTVANNTVYNNGTDYCNNSYRFGDLSQAGGSNNVWINNISESVLTPAYTGPGCGSPSYCGAENAPLVAGDAAGFVDTNNTYIGNVFYGGVGVQLFNNDTTYLSCSNNQCSADPLFISVSAGTIGTTGTTWIPGNGNFGLQGSSPATGYGQTQPFLPATDADSGACNHTLSSCPIADPNY
jgi:parallel beta-helix repeat protein